MNVSNFHKVILPHFISIHLQGGAVFSNNIVRSISGREVRISEKIGSFQKYLLKNCRLSNKEFQILNSFFRNREGSLYSFLIKDFADYNLKDQILTNYDEEIGAYIFEKSYINQESEYRRRIYFLEEQNFASNIPAERIDFENGLFFSQKCEQQIKVNADFYVRVRFDSDILNYAYRDDNSILIENLELIEV